MSINLNFVFHDELQHLRVEENPILKMSHLEAMSILLVGPTLKKFNDRGIQETSVYRNCSCAYDIRYMICYPSLELQLIFQKKNLVPLLLSQMMEVLNVLRSLLMYCAYKLWTHL